MTSTALADTYISGIRTISSGQLVEVTYSAVLGDVVEVVSSIPTVGHKNVFSAFTGIVDSYIYILAIYILLLLHVLYKTCTKQKH